MNSINHIETKLSQITFIKQGLKGTSVPNQHLLYDSFIQLVLAEKQSLFLYISSTCCIDFSVRYVIKYAD